MIHPVTTPILESTRHVDAVEGCWTPVRISGPDNGRVVIVLDESPPESSVFDSVRRRLDVAMLRTVVIPTNPRLTAKSVVGLLDRLDVSGGVLVGDRTDGELAWDVAALERERFTGLVSIDRGHPRTPDVDGVIRDRHCAPVHTDTTVLVSSPAGLAIGRASRRYVHGDFRLAELAGRRGSRHFTAQMAAEIVLRSHAW